MKPTLSVTAALLLTGCMNQAAQQAAQQQATAATQQESYRWQAEAARCNAWLGDTRFDRIRDRISERDPTVERLADADKPSARERELIIQWGSTLDGCMNHGFGPPVGVTWQQRQVALASLAAGEMTYGGYNRKIAELKTGAKAQADQAVAQAAATQAGVQAAIEQARAEAAADALASGITAAIFSSGRRR